MSKSISSVCLFLIVLYFRFEGSAGKESVNFITEPRIPHDCPKGTPISECFKRTRMFASPRVGRSDEPAFSRAQRVFGLVKQPRVGRSDPFAADKDDEAWPRANTDFGAAYSHGVAGTNRENWRSLLAQRRDSGGPWAFFLITPNFQGQEQEPSTEDVAAED